MSFYSTDHHRQASFDTERSCYCYESTVCKAACLLYKKVARKGRLYKLVCTLFDRCYTLKDLPQVYSQCDESFQVESKTRAVDLKKIHGSESCCEDFDSNFNPLNGKNRARWLYIADQYLRGYALPPIDLIQIGEEYFVRDGHQRVSVLRSLGYRLVDARVMVLQGVRSNPERMWIKELVFD